MDFIKPLKIAFSAGLKTVSPFKEIDIVLLNGLKKEAGVDCLDFRRKFETEINSLNPIYSKLYTMFCENISNEIIGIINFTHGQRAVTEKGDLRELTIEVTAKIKNLRKILFWMKISKSFIVMISIILLYQLGFK